MKLKIGLALLFIIGCSGCDNAMEKKYYVEYGKETSLDKILKVDKETIKDKSLDFDCSFLGTYIINVTYKDEKEEKIKIMVEDTKKPIVKLKKDKMEYALDENIVLQENIDSVKDEVDGNIKTLKEVSKEDFDSMIKKAETKNKGLIKREFKTKEEIDKAKKEVDEDIPKEVVLLQSNLKNDKVGTYTVRLAAIDKNYNVTEKQFSIVVSENKKEIAKEEVLKEDEKISDSSSVDITPNQKKDYENSNTVPSTNDPVANAALARVGSKMGCDQLVSDAYMASGKIEGENTYEVPFIPMDRWAMLGSQVSRGNARAGDIIFYNNGGMGGSHVAVYLGQDQAIHGGFNGNDVVRYSVDVGSGPIFYRMPEHMTWTDVARVVFGQQYMDIMDRKNQSNVDDSQKNEQPAPPVINDTPDENGTGQQYMFEVTSDGKAIYFSCTENIESLMIQFMSGGIDKDTLVQQAQAKGCSIS